MVSVEKSTPYKRPVRTGRGPRWSSNAAIYSTTSLHVLSFRFRWNSTRRRIFTLSASSSLYSSQGGQYLTYLSCLKATWDVHCYSKQVIECPRPWYKIINSMLNVSTHKRSTVASVGSVFQSGSRVSSDSLWGADLVPCAAAVPMPAGSCLAATASVSCVLEETGGGVCVKSKPSPTFEDGPSWKWTSPLLDRPPPEKLEKYLSILPLWNL